MQSNLHGAKLELRNRSVTSYVILLRYGIVFIYKLQFVFWLGYEILISKGLYVHSNITILAILVFGNENEVSVCNKSFINSLLANTSNIVSSNSIGI